MFLGLFNIDYDQFEISNQAILFQAVAALVVPLLAALWPVLSGAAITVRQAIASYGVGGDFGSSWIDRLVERVGRRFLVSYYAMALANTFRRKGRLALTQLVLVIAGAMFLMVMSVSSSINTTMDSEFARREHDVIVTFSQMQRVDMTTQLAAEVEGVEKAGVWQVVPATILHAGQKRLDAGMGSQLQGVPVEDPMYRPMMVEGRWLQPGDGRVIVLNKDTADDENIRVGDMISLDLGDFGKAEWQVVGLYRVHLMFAGGFSVDAIYAPREAVYEATKKAGRGGMLLVRTRERSLDGCNTVAQRLEDVFDARHVEIRAIETMPQMRQTADSSFIYLIMMLLVLACIVALVGGIGLMGALWIGVIERTKEIGILRSVGAVSPVILRMFLLEGMIQGLMSWAIAIPVSWLATPLMANALGQVMFKSRLEYSYNFQAVFIWLGVMVVISTLASIIPARSAAQINVRESLSYE
jgi:putative ABC transport system permease protein